MGTVKPVFGLRGDGVYLPMSFFSLKVSPCYGEILGTGECLNQIIDGVNDL